MIYCRVYDMSSPERDSTTCTDELQVFALLSLHESPRKLIRKEDGNNFHCHFALPLPSQVIVFAVGDWDKHVGSNCIVTEVSLESEQLPKRIGILTKENKALCWQAEWGKNFINRSLELLKEDRMAKLTVTIQEKDLQKENQKLAQKVFSTKTSPKTLFSKTSKQGTPGGKTKTSGVLQPRNKNVKLDELWATNGKETKPDTTTTAETYVVTTPVSERKKRTPNSVIKTPAGKRRRANEPSKSQDSSPPQSVFSSPKPSSVISTPTTPYSPAVMSDGVPSSRWGHAVCAINENEALVVGGQGPKFQMVKDSLWLLSSSAAGEFEWSQPRCQESTHADRRMGHSVCYDSETKTLYVYGGSKNKRWFSDVHKLDTTSWTWSLVQTVGKAPTRSYHSCTLYRGEMWVIGGVYPNPDPQPDGCSNDVHVLNLSSKNWYMPITSGDKPTPRSGHSSCLLDSKLVIFGGWDAPTCYNDMFLLDMTFIEFSKPPVTGTTPSPRSWHASVQLPGNKMLISGGFDGIHTTNDTFIFELDSLTWSEISSLNFSARAGHAAFHLARKNTGDQGQEILVFGGGDNKGVFFNDLVILPVQV